MKVLKAAPAEFDLDSIAVYYGALNRSAALEILDRIAGAERTIGDHPFIGRAGRVSGTREAVVVGTPFILVYTVGENSVTVLRVLHTKQQWPN